MHLDNKTTRLKYIEYPWIFSIWDGPERGGVIKFRYSNKHCYREFEVQSRRVFVRTGFYVGRSCTKTYKGDGRRFVTPATLQATTIYWGKCVLQYARTENNSPSNVNYLMSIMLFTYWYLLYKVLVPKYIYIMVKHS